MKSPSQEAFAQIMFWSGIGCLPFSIVLAVVGTFTKKALLAAVSFLLGGLAFTHFLWFFNVLGGSLGTKIGKYVLPSWQSFLPYGLGSALGLFAFWIAFRNLELKRPSQRSDK
jgi:hypothetical protein